ncbi:phage scaffolding protein [Clostridium sp. BJN0001]|uniref:phage scaffolding protein n=1 Tax=Clostridium sp. BJN0001 TaxID=2930219 RepID=UPI001FD1DB8F|nr:phage scaffolding protein [Clostridium sp. BJN0001]
MNLEQVKALSITGLSDEDAKKIADASGKELETYIPKTRFDEVNEAKKTAEGQIKTLTKDLQIAKDNAGDNEELKTQLDNAIQKQKDDAKAFDEQLKDLKISNAIKLAVADTAQDANLVAGLIDKTKLILGEDGKVTGLDEQVKGLKKDKAFLFKEDKSPVDDSKPNPGFHFGNPNPNPTPPDQRMSMHDAIATKLQGQLSKQ